jgi:hypothetical protein
MKSLIKKILNEETKDPLKNYWFNRWTKEEESNKIPKFDIELVQKLGLSNKVKTIEEYYVEYMGGQDRLRYVVAKYLHDNTFTTNEIHKMGISVGGYDFEFRLQDIHFSDETSDVNLDFEVNGTVQLIMVDDSIHDLKDLSSLDDTSTWEIDWEVKDILKEFVEKVLASFSIEYNDIDIIWN